MLQSFLVLCQESHHLLYCPVEILHVVLDGRILPLLYLKEVLHILNTKQKLPHTLNILSDGTALELGNLGSNSSSPRF